MAMFNLVSFQTSEVNVKICLEDTAQTCKTSIGSLSPPLCRGNDWTCASLVQCEETNKEAETPSWSNVENDKSIERLSIVVASNFETARRRLLIHLRWSSSCSILRNGIVFPDRGQRLKINHSSLRYASIHPRVCLLDLEDRYKCECNGTSCATSYNVAMPCLLPEVQPMQMQKIVRIAKSAVGGQVGLCIGNFRIFPRLRNRPVVYERANLGRFADRRCFLSILAIMFN